MNDRVRGFPAFPPQRAGARFASSWWGRAWIKAMEDTSLDHNLLRKGRAHARAGTLGPITVSPGRLAATAGELSTVVHVEQLSDAEWDRFLDQVAAKAGHIAALLDGDMPHELVEAAEEAAIALLPSVGDLEPSCDCPDWGHPCQHAAALCYQASWLLDDDPFVLLLLRGRDRQDLLGELQARHPTTAEPAPGTPVDEAYAHGVPPLPAPPSGLPEHTPLLVEPAPGVHPDALRVLAADAALRARDLLSGAQPAALTEFQDRIRLTATHHLADGPDVRAWRYGGAPGLDVQQRAWNPPKQDLARARTAWAAENLPEVTATRNQWTVGGLQLRYGRDGLWYPFVDRSGEWWPAAPPERDPVTAMSEAQNAAPSV